MLKSTQIILEEDIIEIFEINLIRNKPFFIRLLGYNNKYELRLSKDDILALADSIYNIVNTKEEE